MRKLLFVIVLIFGFSTLAQEVVSTTKNDSAITHKSKTANLFKTGYYPIGFFDVDIKYLLKYNNYEGLRLGLGGVTNTRFSDKYKISGYVARSFIDEKIKYSIGGSARLNEERNTWLNLFYINDITEIGASIYLTDERVYSVFEPRLINITQFYKHITWQTNIQHEFTPKILSEFRISKSHIEQTLNYTYYNNDNYYSGYELAEVSASVRFSPKTNYLTRDNGKIEYFDGLPRISVQVTQGIKGIDNSDFNYTKFGLRFDYLLKSKNRSFTHILWENSLALGDVPLTHLYHAYPNNPTKGKILKRFSVAGRTSFETMYFGEFFSDRLSTLQIKHGLKSFKISNKVKPEFVILTRHAIGDMKNTDQHIGLDFSTLEEFYSESGFELNQIIFGFGVSLVYRYGYYSLPDFDDNLSFKFTFYLNL